MMAAGIFYVKMRQAGGYIIYHIGWRPIFLFLDLSLTTKQHGFELHESTYTWTFSKNIAALHHRRLVESTHIEPQTQGRL